jgi:putative aldouronate transport system permease protein
LAKLWRKSGEFVVLFERQAYYTEFISDPLLGLPVTGPTLQIDRIGLMETPLSIEKNSQPLVISRAWASFWRGMRRSWRLYVMISLPLIWLLVFQYYPMYGAQIAFRNFLPGDTLFNADWVGLDNFRRFFQSSMFLTVIKNTLGLSLYSLVAGFPIPILFALSLNQLRNGLFKNTVQMVSYAPYFISTVVMVGMLLQFLDLRIGPVNIILQNLGFSGKNFMGDAKLFPSLYVWSGIWQYTGFNTVIYLAALSGVDPSLHEAAVMDGANRLHRIWFIDLPGIMPTAVTLLILNMGQMINVGFEKVFLMQNPLNLRISEVISTYVYKVGLVGGVVNFSYAAAIGLLNSLVGFIILIIANQLMKKISNTSLW